jgi:hypothetical protein
MPPQPGGLRKAFDMAGESLQLSTRAHQKVCLTDEFLRRKRENGTIAVKLAENSSITYVQTLCTKECLRWYGCGLPANLNRSA